MNILTLGLTRGLTLRVTLLVASLHVGAGAVSAEGLVHGLYVSGDTRSVYGNEVHRSLTQHLFLESLIGDSALELIEEPVSSRRARLVLRSAVRDIHAWTFDVARRRELPAAEIVARDFLRAAMSAGVLQKLSK